jgi:predicted small secreted protein
VKKFLIVAVAAASLGLSACGTKATIDQAVSSLGSTSDLQVHFTVSATGAGSAQAQKILSALSLDVDYSNPTGSALSQSNGKANAEVIVNAGGAPVVDVRDISGTLYVEVNVSALNNIPTVNLSSTDLAAAQLLLGGRWFELPTSLLTSFSATSKISAEAAQEEAATKKIADAIEKVIDTSPSTTLSSGGFSETGSLQSIVTAVLPTIESLANNTEHPGAVKGSYTLVLNTSGSTATGASIKITAPNGTQGNASVQLTATIAHANDDIVAPSGATVLTKSMLEGLLSEAK